LAEIYFVISNDGQMLVWGGVSLGVLNLTITLYNKLGDSKNAKTVFFGRNTCLQNNNKLLEVRSAVSTAFDV
jgi:hypothetical protein